MIRLLSAILLALFLIASCDTDSSDGVENISVKDTLSIEQLDSMRQAETIAKHDTFPKINYKRVYITGWKHVKEIKEKYSSKTDKNNKYKVLKTLNRKEMRFFDRGDTIVVPDTIADDMLYYSIFPQYYWEARKIPKLIMVSNAYQAYACYEYGKQVRFAASNTGKERTPTYPGRYALSWKEREHLSSLDSNWVMPYTWNFHAYAGSAFHQFVMPGRPVSHSCCRQFMDDARWLYYWGEGDKYDSNGRRIDYSGTPVIITDIFNFDRKRFGPWLDLKSNKDTILELPEKPMEIEMALIPWCQIPGGSKLSIPNRERYIHAEDTLRARGIIDKDVRLIHTKNYNEERRKKEKLAKKKEEERKQKELEEKLRKYLEDYDFKKETNINSRKIREENNESGSNSGEKPDNSKENMNNEKSVKEESKKVPE